MQTPPLEASGQEQGSQEWMWLHGLALLGQSGVLCSGIVPRTTLHLPVLLHGSQMQMSPCELRTTPLPQSKSLLSALGSPGGSTCLNPRPSLEERLENPLPPEEGAEEKS